MKLKLRSLWNEGGAMLFFWGGDYGRSLMLGLKALRTSPYNSISRSVMYLALSDLRLSVPSLFTE